MPLVVEVHELRKSYDRIERLHGISLEIAKGEIFGFLGVNGAGKTTTIEILEGYRSRDSGEVTVLGSDPERAGRSWRNRIGLVLQDSTLNPVYTVRETVSMFARYFIEPTSVDRVLHQAGLARQADERIGRLSGGQKRRVDVAIGLVGDPEILFLDEPTTGLDPAARRETWKMIGELRDANKTVFLTTHYMDEAQHLADRVVILRAGQVVAEGTPEKLSHSFGTTSEISFAAPVGISSTTLEEVIGHGLCLEAGMARFSSDEPQRELTILLEWANRTGLELGDLQVRQPTLDDVFVQLAGPNRDEPVVGSSES